MKNPWEDIKLSDYESHMSLESVYQLQVVMGLNIWIKKKFVLCMELTLTKVI